MSTVEQDVKTTVDELLKAISTKNVVAEPIEVGDNVLITIARVGLGLVLRQAKAKETRASQALEEGQEEQPASAR